MRKLRWNNDISYACKEAFRVYTTNIRSLGNMGYWFGLHSNTSLALKEVVNVSAYRNVVYHYFLFI